MKKQTKMFLYLAITTLNLIAAHSPDMGSQNAVESPIISDVSQTDFTPPMTPEPHQAVASSWSLMNLSASGSLDITAVATNERGVTLLVGWFRGALTWEGGTLQANHGAMGFSAAIDRNGSVNEPRLWGWEAGLLPLNARSFEGGFKVLVHDLMEGDLLEIYLSSDGDPIGTTSVAVHGFRDVVQPEDLPEGSGENDVVQPEDLPEGSGGSSVVQPEDLPEGSGG